MAPPVKSAQRVLDLLEFFADERRPASVGVIAQSLGWPQSSTSVLLKGLAETGYFDHDGRTGLYAPNVRIALATAWLQEHLYSEQNLLRLMEIRAGAYGAHGDDRQTRRASMCATSTCFKRRAKAASSPRPARCGRSFAAPRARCC